MARGLLGQYMRYSALMSEQEQALAREDFEAFERLGDELADLRIELGSREGVHANPRTDELQQAAEVLRAAVATNMRIQSRLSEMRRGRGDQIKTLSTRRPQTRTYVGAPATAAAGLDVRL
jgi:hypothetical protein